VTERRGIPFVVSAPSGTGKTTICRRVVEADDALVFSISHTTRPRRQGETDGADYHFVSEVEFQQLVDEGAFLEWAVYNDHRYGTSWEAIEAPLAEGCDALLEIEIQGARQVRTRRDDARFIFLLPPSFQVLRQRLEARGTDSADQIARRLSMARREFAALPEFDYAVINDQLEESVGSVCEIVRAVRAGEIEGVRERYSPAAVRRRLASGEEAEAGV
jgi:guanylate kinase